MTIQSRISLSIALVAAAAGCAVDDSDHEITRISDVPRLADFCLIAVRDAPAYREYPRHTRADGILQKGTLLAMTAAQGKYAFVWSRDTKVRAWIPMDSFEDYPGPDEIDLMDRQVVRDVPYFRDVPEDGQAKPDGVIKRGTEVYVDDGCGNAYWHIWSIDGIHAWVSRSAVELIPGREQHDWAFRPIIPVAGAGPAVREPSPPGKKSDSSTRKT